MEEHPRLVSTACVRQQRLFLPAVPSEAVRAGVGDGDGIDLIVLVVDELKRRRRQSAQWPARPRDLRPRRTAARLYGHRCRGRPPQDVPRLPARVYAAARAQRL